MISINQSIIVFITVIYSVCENVHGKYMSRCDFVNTFLQYKRDVTYEELNKWTCIAQYQSNFDSSVVNYDTNGNGYYGIFQVSSQYWCSRSPYEQRACNLHCDQLRDNYFYDDFECVQRIYAEHQRLSGDGFNAWMHVYNSYCQNIKHVDFVKDCYSRSGQTLYSHNVFLKGYTGYKVNYNYYTERKQHKIFERCELARELYYLHDVPYDEVATWVCIARYESQYNTSAVGYKNTDGSLDHGIFQISDIYWCSPPGTGWACGLSCAKLENADISDDVICMKKIYNEHQRLSGDGYTAWASYIPHCRSNVEQFISGCFDSDTTNSISPPYHYPAVYYPFASSETKEYMAKEFVPKIFTRCELAKELLHVHNIPKNQVHVWVCIAEKVSNFNVSAYKGSINAGASHGLFQVSDMYWCETSGVGGSCNLNCADLRDNDLTNDVKCIRKIYDEHERIFGNGFHAWLASDSRCKGKTTDYTKDCFEEDQDYNNVIIPSTDPSIKSTQSKTVKIYEQCELANELVKNFDITEDEASSWVCIVKFQSNFNTSAVGIAEHGIFQISNRYWCDLSGDGKGCNIACSKLEDSDISDDFACAKKIHAEHEQLFGNGFNAWAIYDTACKDHLTQYSQRCFANSRTITTAITPPTRTTTLSTTEKPFGKVYERCELAKELRFQHNMPRNQIHMWVCIAEHESNLNTSAIGRLNADGSSDHGIFQISDIYWCSLSGSGKACNIPCSKLRDSYLLDDMKCVRKIYAEHQQLSGDGYTAWAVYQTKCKHQSAEYIEECFDDGVENTIKIDTTTEKRINWALAPTVPVKQTITENKLKLTVGPGAAIKESKTYERCELARELSYKHNFPREQIGDWVCIAQHVSNFVTSAKGSNTYGIFQINGQYWCNSSGDITNKACNVDCSNLLDSDITDDIKCVKKIHDIHQNLYADGFTAWPLHDYNCKQQSKNFTSDCFPEEISVKLPKEKVTTTVKPKQHEVKVYGRCELANELLHRHKIQKDQIGAWVCIALYQSNYVTAASGQGAYGIWQISSAFWCLDENNGPNECNIPCEKLQDSDITDDVKCIKQIYDRHLDIFGNGFHAWPVFNFYCKGQSNTFVADCFKNEPSNGIIHKSKMLRQENPTATSIDSDTGKVYSRCDLARELRYKHNIPKEQIPDWVCIAHYQSNLITSAVGQGMHGIFQISSRNGCLSSGDHNKTCDVLCSKLEDSDITDDVKCIQTIFKEHQHKYGNGFQAWAAVYEPYCRDQSSHYTKGCFNEDSSITTHKPTPKSTTRLGDKLTTIKTIVKLNTPIKQINVLEKPAGKIYERCELAKELRYKYNLPKDQIHHWVCIAQYQSNFNTSALTAVQTSGSRNYGVFQISDQWCGGEKLCKISCSQLINSDISDDVKCIKNVFEEHNKISGNGFQHGWSSYEVYCKYQTSEYTRDCFEEDVNRTKTNITTPAISNAIPTKGKVYTRCELARELRFKYNLPRNQIHTWICIAWESNLNTSTITNRNSDSGTLYGLFQIDKYFCSDLENQGKLCGLPCSKLTDTDLSDDVHCIQKIFAENKKLYGNGFSHSWVAYESNCKYETYSIVNDCFEVDDYSILPEYTEKTVTSTNPSKRQPSSSNVGKVYTQCELAHELRFKHSIPMEQIPTWVCIAMHESNFNTSAVGHTSPDGSGDHGIFQISDIYWCSPPGKGWSCGLSCANLEDNDITDDVECIKRIFEEHQQLSGDGWNAWKVYEKMCKGKANQYATNCFDGHEIKKPLITSAFQPANCTYSNKTTSNYYSYNTKCETNHSSYNYKYEYSQQTYNTSLPVINNQLIKNVFPSSTQQPQSTKQRISGEQWFPTITQIPETFSVYSLYLNRFSTLKPTTKQHNYSFQSQISSTKSPPSTYYYSSASTTQSPFNTNKYNTYKIPTDNQRPTTATPQTENVFFQRFFNTEVSKFSSSYSHLKTEIVNAPKDINASKINLSNQAITEKSFTHTKGLHKIPTFENLRQASQRSTTKTATTTYSSIAKTTTSSNKVQSTSTSPSKAFRLNSQTTKLAATKASTRILNTRANIKTSPTHIRTFSTPSPLSKITSFPTKTRISQSVQATSSPKPFTGITTSTTASFYNRYYSSKATT